MPSCIATTRDLERFTFAGKPTQLSSAIRAASWKASPWTTCWLWNRGRGIRSWRTRSNASAWPNAQDGIDLIYQGLLRYGRPAPDYRRSDSKSVVVVLPGGEANVGTLQTITEEENRLNSALPVDSMIALSLLRQERRVDTVRLAQAIQKDEASARTVAERLVEAGLVEPHGVKKGRTYTLSPKVYQAMGQPADYVRQAGFDAIQQEQMVLQYVQAHQRITRKDVVSLCRISEDQAGRLLRKLKRENRLRQEGKGRATYYKAP